MNSPYISVIIPAYNTETYITETLQSLQDQAYTDFEAIIIDDASTDCTAKLAESFTVDPRFRVIRREQNGGVSAARNVGIKEARGEWIAFIDADDLWLPDKLEKQVELIQQNTDVALVFSNGVEFDESGDIGVFYKECHYFPEGNVLNRLFRKNCFSTSTVMVRRSDLISVGMFDVTYTVGEDYLVWFNILFRGGQTAGVRKPVVRYRNRCGSLTHDKVSSFRDLERIHREWLKLNISSKQRNILCKTIARDRRDLNFACARVQLDKKITSAAKYIIRGWLCLPYKIETLIWAGLLFTPNGKRVVAKQLARHW